MNRLRRYAERRCTHPEALFPNRFKSGRICPICVSEGPQIGPKEQKPQIGNGTEWNTFRRGRPENRLQPPALRIPRERIKFILGELYQPHCAV